MRRKLLRPGRCTIGLLAAWCPEFDATTTVADLPPGVYPPSLVERLS